MRKTLTLIAALGVAISGLAVVRMAFAQSPDVAPATAENAAAAGRPVYTLDNCVNTFDPARIEKTGAGYQYWFADRDLAGGKTVKLSVVRAGTATHAAHRHAEDEFFFVLEGRAEFTLEGATKVVGPNTNLYCPSGSLHGIRNAGDGELKYLVIKQYPARTALAP